ncbi:hypothetical protein SuUB63_20740 [Streptococcus uberis]
MVILSTCNGENLVLSRLGCPSFDVTSSVEEDGSIPTFLLMVKIFFAKIFCATNIIMEIKAKSNPINEDPLLLSEALLLPCVDQQVVITPKIKSNKV